MNTALRNVNALLRLTTNLINFERADVYSSELYISEHELNTFTTEIYNAFQQYANIKHINFTHESNFRYMNVWFDKEKMESILKNIISNALKYSGKTVMYRFSCPTIQTRGASKLGIQESEFRPANRKNCSTCISVAAMQSTPK